MPAWRHSGYDDYGLQVADRGTELAARFARLVPGVRPARLLARHDVHQGTRDPYEAVRPVAEKARNDGYDIIEYWSERGPGRNYAVIDHWDVLLEKVDLTGVSR